MNKLSLVGMQLPGMQLPFRFTSYDQAFARNVEVLLNIFQVVAFLPTKHLYEIDVHGTLDSRAFDSK